MRLPPRQYFIGLIIIMLSGRLQAAPIPDAGILLQQQERKRPLPEGLRPTETAVSEHPEPGAGMVVKVSRFVFSGYEGIATEAELQSLVSDSVNKSLSMGELKVLVSKLTFWIRDRGWVLSRAYLPEQDVSGGVVEIRLEQGRVDGKINYSPDRRVRLRASQFQGMGDAALSAEGALNQRRLERSLLLMNDLPGIRATAMISPGSKTGTSMLRIGITEGPPVSGTLSSDNMGNAYTGIWRGNGMVFLNDPLRIGDQLGAMLTVSDGLVQGRASYVVPLWCDGLKARLSYTGMTYELTDGEFSSLDYSGSSNWVEAGLSHPLHRSRNANITAVFSYGSRTMVDHQGPFDIHDKHAEYGTLGLIGDRFDQLFGDAATTWNLSITRGVLHDRNPAALTDAQANRTEGEFKRVNLGIARMQNIADRTTLALNWSSQLSVGNLDSSERFSLGGPDGVRAYPLGEAAGDNGHLINADLRYTLPFPSSWGNLEISGFYDAGRITIQHDRTMSILGTATERNTYWLQGAGIGLSYSYRGRVTLRSVWAHMIGDNPGRSISGNNYDGHADRSRFWVQAAYRF